MSYVAGCDLLILVWSISLVFIVLNGRFAIKEITNRFRDETAFRSRALKWTSFLSITSGLWYSFCYPLYRVNGFCYFMQGLSSIVKDVQPVWVGLYQLSRLYHLFSSKEMNPRGYPNVLFVVMITVAVLYALTITAVDGVVAIPSRCWLDIKELNFHYKYMTVLEFKEYGTLYCLMMAICLCWDLTTLVLFMFQIRSLTNSASDGTNAVTPASIHLVTNIQRQMERIVILTVFYMVMNVILTLWIFSSMLLLSKWTIYRNVVDILLNMMQPLVMSYAVYLMQRHNSKQYGQFLQRITCCKVHWICCKYRGVVLKQMDFFYPDTYNMEELRAGLLSMDETGTAYNEFSMDDPPNPKYSMEMT